MSSCQVYLVTVLYQWNNIILSPVSSLVHISAVIGHHMTVLEVQTETFFFFKRDVLKKKKV